MPFVSEKGLSHIGTVVEKALAQVDESQQHNRVLGEVVKIYAAIIQELVANVLDDQVCLVTIIGSSVRGTALPGRTDVDFYVQSPRLPELDDKSVKALSHKLNEAYYAKVGFSPTAMRSSDVVLAHTIGGLKDSIDSAKKLGISSFEVFIAGKKPAESELVSVHNQLLGIQAEIPGASSRAIILKSVLDQLGIYGTNTNPNGRGFNGLSTELLALNSRLSDPEKIQEFILEMVDLIFCMATDCERQGDNGMVNLSLQSLVPDRLAMMPNGLKTVLAGYRIAKSHADVLERRLCSS
ncbi:hypothetical protein KA036_00660 [Candidatus Gracilibacteria bacterium]|nr:hypothetical protein [Candidatus Gracilibacteria bacterium]